MSFQAPSSHKSEECKKQTRQFQGHQKDWWFLASRERLQMLAKMTSTIKTTSTPHQTQIQALESLEESQDEAQEISQDKSQDHSESQNESQEESQHESQDESYIEDEVETLAEGSLMTAHADNNITENEMKNVMKQRYEPPEERCRQGAEKENDEDTRRLSLSNFPPLSKNCSLAFQFCLFAFQFCSLTFIIAMVEDTS